MDKIGYLEEVFAPLSIDRPFSLNLLLVHLEPSMEILSKEK
jgi:hypothetical protein